MLYRSWSHNAVATFSLYLLAQAYRHATDLIFTLYVICLLFVSSALYLFLLFFFFSRLSYCSANIEITVTLLMEIDKLIQLLESPIFICNCAYLLTLFPFLFPFLFIFLYFILYYIILYYLFLLIRYRFKTAAA